MTDFIVQHKDKKWETYGNNYFILTTKVNGVTFEMDGIMQELPPLSLSSEWESSPAATLGEILGEIANSPFLEFCAQQGNVSTGVHMVNADQMTSRTFKSGSKMTFDIKFRCYPGQKVGPHNVRTANEWIRLLALTTPVNSNCGVNIENIINEGGAAFDGVMNLLNAVGGGDKKTDDTQADKRTMRELADEYAKQLNSIRSDNQEESNAAKQKAIGYLYGAADNNFTDKKDSALARTGITTLESSLSAQNAAAGLAGTVAETKLENTTLYGANVFMLRIFPFIFKQQFSVYVNSWTVTPSREWNATVQDHYYYDFSMQVSMDQTPSAITYHNALYRDDYNAVQNKN